MLEAMRQAPPLSAIVLQVCAHNPTGVDLAEADWDAAFELIDERGLIPIFDIAYHGFATGDF